MYFKKKNVVTMAAYLESVHFSLRARLEMVE